MYKAPYKTDDYYANNPNFDPLLLLKTISKDDDKNKVNSLNNSQENKTDDYYANNPNFDPLLLLKTVSRGDDKNKVNSLNNSQENKTNNHSTISHKESGNFTSIPNYSSSRENKGYTYGGYEPPKNNLYMENKSSTFGGFPSFNDKKNMNSNNNSSGGYKPPVSNNNFNASSNNDFSRYQTPGMSANNNFNNSSNSFNSFNSSNNFNSNGNNRNFNMEYGSYIPPKSNSRQNSHILDINPQTETNNKDDINFSAAEEVGFGGSSSIRKAKLNDGRSVIIKRFNNDSGDDILFLTEVDIMARVIHPNLMSFISLKLLKNFGNVVQYVDKLSIIMDEMSSDLDKGGKHLPLTTITKIFYETTSALAYLHKNNILHLDIKPGNILIKYIGPGSYCTKLTDMGLSITVNPKIRYYLEPAPMFNNNSSNNLNNSNNNLNSSNLNLNNNSNNNVNNLFADVDQSNIVGNFNSNTNSNSSNYIPNININQNSNKNIITISGQNYIVKIIPNNMLIRNYIRESISIPYRPFELFNLDIVSDRSDVWSLAITFLEMISGTSSVKITGIFNKDVLQIITLLDNEENKKNFIYNLLRKNSANTKCDLWYSLINNMLKVNFIERISCDEILNHPIFQEFHNIESNSFRSNNSNIIEDNTKYTIRSENIVRNHYTPNLSTLTGLLIILKYSSNLNLFIETVFLGIDLYYRTLKRLKLNHDKYNVHLIAFNCILIASKLVEDIGAIVSIDNLRTASDNIYEIKELIEMESQIVLCHNGKLYLDNLFHKCKCKHDLITALNIMCNPFVYPYINQFESQCWSGSNCNSLDKNIVSSCTRPVELNNDLIQAEMEMYPIKISQIIEHSIFVKNEYLIAESQCSELYAELSKKK